MRISDVSSDVCSSDLPAPSVPGGSRHVDAMLAPLDFARAERRLRMDLTQLLHHFVGDFIIAPDGLDIIVVIERVDQLEQLLRRSEERRVGKECVSTCRSGWPPYH